MQLSPNHLFVRFWEQLKFAFIAKDIQSVDSVICKFWRPNTSHALSPPNKAADWKRRFHRSVSEPAHLVRISHFTPRRSRHQPRSQVHARLSTFQVSLRPSACHRSVGQPTSDLSEMLPRKPLSTASAKCLAHAHCAEPFSSSKNPRILTFNLLYRSWTISTEMLGLDFCPCLTKKLGRLRLLS